MCMIDIIKRGWMSWWCFVPLVNESSSRSEATALKMSKLEWSIAARWERQTLNVTVIRIPLRFFLFHYLSVIIYIFNSYAMFDPFGQSYIYFITGGLNHDFKRTFAALFIVFSRHTCKSVTGIMTVFTEKKNFLCSTWLPVRSEREFGCPFISAGAEMSVESR